MQLKKEIKFETLKKSHKKQIIIGSVLVCVIGSILTFNLTKAKYRLTQSMKLVTGTINYKVPDLRIVALYTENDNKEYVESDDVPTSGYTLNEEKSLCRVYDGTTSVAEAPIDTKATITYHDGVIGFDNISKKNTRCYLYFDKIVIPPEPTDDTLVKLEIDKSKVIEQTDTVPDFSKTATTDEGIFKVEDGMYGGYSYYWRGAATTNHVIFANKCWRIVRINGDGSIRLIYNGVPSGTAPNQTCQANPGSASIAVSSQSYSKGAVSNNSAYVGYTYTVSEPRPTPTTGGTESNLKTQTETWFDSNITGENLNKVDMQGKYCNDRTIGSGTWSATGNNFYYGAYARLETNKTPTLSCYAEDVYELKAGAITADEVSMVGEVYGSGNTSYYLYNGQYYWTMSPYGWNIGYASVFFVNADGYLSDGYVRSTALGVRPVINLRSNVEFNSGSDGTQNNPYIVQ